VKLFNIAIATSRNSTVITSLFERYVAGINSAQRCFYTIPFGTPRKVARNILGVPIDRMNLFFVVDGSIHPEKKVTGNYDAKFPSIVFGWILHPQTKQINLFLII
jgi:hypothetical protein